MTELFIGKCFTYIFVFLLSLSCSLSMLESLESAITPSLNFYHKVTKMELFQFRINILGYDIVD